MGYGVKIFLPSPPNYVTRSPGRVTSKIRQHYSLRAIRQFLSVTRGPILERPETFRMTILYVSSKRKCYVSQNFAVILIFIPLTTYKSPALQNKQVGVLRMAFRTRKVFGSFEKRTPGPVSRKSREIFRPEKLVVELQSTCFEKLIF